MTTTSTLCPTLTETLNKIASNHTPSQTTVVPVSFDLCSGVPVTRIALIIFFQAPSQTPVSELRSFQSPESSQILGTVTPVSASRSPFRHLWVIERTYCTSYACQVYLLFRHDCIIVYFYTCSFSCGDECTCIYIVGC